MARKKKEKVLSQEVIIEEPISVNHDSDDALRCLQCDGEGLIKLQRCPNCLGTGKVVK